MSARQLLLYGLAVTALVSLPASAVQADPGLELHAQSAAGRLLEGDIAFWEPAQANASLVPQDAWYLRTSMEAPGANTSAKAAFAMEGGELDLIYVHWKVGQQLDPTTGGTRSPATAGDSQVGHHRFQDFRITVEPQPGKRALTIIGNLDAAIRVQTTGPWALWTEPVKGDGDLGAFAPPTQNMVVAYGRGLELESTEVRVLHTYGFDVVVQHAEGTARFKTGTWLESDRDGLLGGFPAGSPAVHEGYVLAMPRNSLLHVSADGPLLRLESPTLVAEGRIEFSRTLVELGDMALPGTEGETSLELEGALLLKAQTAPSSRLAAGFHQLHVRGLARPSASSDDASSFASEAIAGSLPKLPVLMALGLVALFVKVVLALFTRLSKATVLEAKPRRLVYEAIMAEPGIALPALRSRHGMTRSSLRYHLRVLERQNQIRAFKLGREWRFAAATLDVRRVRASAALGLDAKLRFVVETVQREGPVAAPHVLAGLRARWRISDWGGRKLLRRAERLALIHSRRDGARLLFAGRPTTEASAPA